VAPRPFTPNLSLSYNCASLLPSVFWCPRTHFFLPRILLAVLMPQLLFALIPFFFIPPVINVRFPFSGPVSPFFQFQSPGLGFFPPPVLFVQPVPPPPPLEKFPFSLHSESEDFSLFSPFVLHPISPLSIVFFPPPFLLSFRWQASPPHDRDLPRP